MSFPSKKDFDNKVDKEVGKGLSTEDYTSAEKTKLAGFEINATATESGGVKVRLNGTTAYFTNNGSDA